MKSTITIAGAKINLADVDIVKRHRNNTFSVTFIRGGKPLKLQWVQADYDALMSALSCYVWKRYKETGWW